MKTNSKYYPLLKPLLNRPVFTAREAQALGVTYEALLYFVRIGLLERIERGVYKNPLHCSEIPVDLEGLVSSVLTIPNGVICLISALSYYEMTDEIPRRHWIAIPNSQRAPIRDLAKIIRMRNLTLGQTSVDIAGYQVRIFDRERCVVDAFRYLSKEIAIKALQAYLKGDGFRPDLTKLHRYAKELRSDITPYIQSLTT